MSDGRTGQVRFPEGWTVVGAGTDLVERRLLDHGYLRYVEHWGSDERVIEAARMSTQKGFQGWGPLSKCSQCGSVRSDLMGERCPNCDHHTFSSDQPGDEKLLKYLYDNKHSTPFEFAGIVVEVQAPIFVFREWHRHRTQSYNEMSARYAPLPDLNYVPTVDRMMMGGGHLTKQAGAVKGAKVLNRDGAANYRDHLHAFYRLCESNYQAALDDGIPKEIARIILPVGRYSRMRASANLRNWLAFLTLRQAPQAQWEIRQYADALSDLVKALFPRTHALYAGGA